MPATGVTRRQLGDAAEDAALAHAFAQGATLIARNVSYPFGELDLVLHDRGAIAFVEVRRRRGMRFGGAFASVDAAKRRKVARAAQAWLKANRAAAALPCRFDVVAVELRAGELHCDWLRNAWTLDDLW